MISQIIVMERNKHTCTYKLHVPFHISVCGGVLQSSRYANHPPTVDDTFWSVDRPWSSVTNSLDHRLAGTPCVVYDGRYR
jgi:hypothetical protein